MLVRQVPGRYIAVILPLQAVKPVILVRVQGCDESTTCGEKCKLDGHSEKKHCPLGKWCSRMLDRDLFREAICYTLLFSVLALTKISPRNAPMAVSYDP